MAAPSFDVTAEGFPGKCDRAEDGLRGVEERKQIAGLWEDTHRFLLGTPARVADKVGQHEIL